MSTRHIMFNSGFSFKRNFYITLQTPLINNSKYQLQLLEDL